MVGAGAEVCCWLWGEESSSSRERDLALLLVWPSRTHSRRADVRSMNGE